MDSKMMASSSRRRYYQSSSKPQWEVEKENAERERLATIARNLEKTEENFPRLGGGEAKTTSWGGRKFTELAYEWKAEDDHRKAMDDEAKGAECQKTERFALPTFTPSRHYVETDEGEMTPLPDVPPPKVGSEDDVWTSVDRNAKFAARQARKQKRLEEKLKRYDEGEEPEPADDDQNDRADEDDSCWNSHLIGYNKKSSDF